MFDRGALSSREPRQLVDGITHQLQIVRITAAMELDSLAVLYRELHIHQLAGAPLLGDLTPRDPNEAWTLRRRRYERWLKQNGTFLLTATVQDRIVGFALVTVSPGYDGWRSGEWVGEL